MKQFTNCSFFLAALAVAMIFASCGQQTKPEAAAPPHKPKSTDDQPITMSGGSIKLVIDSKASWRDGVENNNQLLTYVPTNGMAAKIGQIQLKGTSGDSTTFDYLARRDPANALNIDVEFGNKSLINPKSITVSVESARNADPAARDALLVRVLDSIANPKFDRIFSTLHRLSRAGWQIKKVTLSSGLIAVPANPSPPTVILVKDNDFSMLLHHCELDPNMTDGSCKP